VSDAAGALTVRTKPIKMNTPTRGSLTTTTLLHLDWVALTADADIGGSTITSYDFEWDANTNQLHGSPTWYHLQGYGTPSLALTIQITSGVVPGKTYLVRVSAGNVYGFGVVGDSFTIHAA
jgi:hypothetical protein